MGYSSLLTIDRRAYRLRTVSIILATVLCAAGVISLSFTRLNHNAAAATPPDSCFEFDTETGTITDYYNNEDNDGSNPACPKDVDIPSTINGTTVTSIGINSEYLGAFQAKSITSVTLPASLTSLGDVAFYDNSLTSVVIPSSVTSIGKSTFASNQLSSVALPSSLISIGPNAFSGNELSSVTIPDSTTSIGIEAFANNRINSVTLGDSLETVGNGAFSMNNISSLTIPQSVTSIGTLAFGINKLSSVTIEGEPALGSGVFMTNGPTVSTEDYLEALQVDYYTALQYLINHSVYVPIYDQNNSIQDTVYYEWETFGSDVNDDGIDNPIGGHIINRPQLTVEHINEDGTEIAPNVMRVGMSLNSYAVASNPEANLSRYYEPGEEVTETPEPITGYDTPDPQTRTLAAGQNTVTFVYAEADDSGDDGDNSGNSGGDNNGGTSGQDNTGESTDGTVPGAPNTGFAQINPSSPFTLAAVIAVPALLLASAWYYKTHKRQSN